MKKTLKKIKDNVVKKVSRKQIKKKIKKEDVVVEVKVAKKYIGGKEVIKIEKIDDKYVVTDIAAATFVLSKNEYKEYVK